MDDHRRAAASESTAYRCPGETYSIERPVHLARLASFYPPCVGCSHRHDTAGLSAQQLRQRDQVERRSASGLAWQGEGLESSTLRDLDETVVARVAAALAADFWRRNPSSQRLPAVLVGSDGHWTTAGLVASACRSLQLGGCSAVEVGAVTSAALAVASAVRKADAALWIGNAAGEPHHQSVKLWHQGGLPASSPGALDGVIDCYESQPRRAKRHGGGSQRFSVDAEYLPRLIPIYHALRPLVLVLDTTCEVLVRVLAAAGRRGGLSHRAAGKRRRSCPRSRRTVVPPAAIERHRRRGARHRGAFRHLDRRRRRNVPDGR